jgi:glyoxylase-like metal-dependent hydrolase (beta-lactamase superfamily II)
MQLEQLRPHLWRWTAPHPDWRPGADWDQEVSCAAVVCDEEFLLVDPLAPAGEDAERFWRAVDRDIEHHGAPHVVLTVPWHVRSTAEVVRRYPGTRVWAYEPGAADVDLATDQFGDGDPLPGGLLPFGAHGEPEAVLWSGGHRALITGDVILSSDGGLRLLPSSWLSRGVTLAQVREALAPLLDLPVELILPAHGEPVTEDAAAALARALSA